MKFSIEKTVGNSRLGLLCNLTRLPSFKVETPNLLLYTQGGAIPHLTGDTFRKVTDVNQILYFPIPNIFHYHERMKKFCGSIGDFIGMEGHLTYAAIVDSGQKRIAGYHTRDHVPVWSKTGKSDVNSESYMDLLEALKPDLFLTLCDCDTDFNASNKRTVKSLERTLEFFKQCMDLYEKSENLKDSKIIGPLIGGYDMKARENCSAVVGKAPVFGVAIDGLHDCSNEVPLMDFKLIEPMVEASLKHVSDEQLRICHGPWHPSVVLDLISMGIDFLDTSYPYMVTKCNGALTFPNDERICEELVDQMQTNNLNENTLSNCEYNDSEGPLNKKLKMNSYPSELYILLSDNIYAETFEPITKNCICYTCRNHTKAYIHHLIHVKELLGQILLTIHNLHHYFTFFRTIRTALKEEKLGVMKNNFERLFPTSLRKPSDSIGESTK